MYLYMYISFDDGMPTHTCTLYAVVYMKTCVGMYMYARNVVRHYMSCTADLHDMYC